MLEVAPTGSRRTAEAERAYLEAFPQRGIFLLAVDAASDRVVGFQSMEPFADYTGAFDHVGVLGTYVSLERRGRGIAGALFPRTFEQARAKRSLSRSSCKQSAGAARP